MPSLSRSATARGLRMFLYTGPAWGVYNQVVSVSSPILVGFALWAGARGSDIGLLAAFAYLGGFSQPLSVLLTTRIQRKKSFVICAGVGECLFLCAIVLTPLFLSGRVRVMGMLALVMAGNLMSHLLSPLFNSWLATVIPEDIRARYLSKRAIARDTSSIIAIYLMGRTLDSVPAEHQYIGFVALFAAGLLTGLAGYFFLMKAPFPPIGQASSSGSFHRMFSLPFRDRNFRAYLAFEAAWSFATGIAAPFYNVFMIQSLHINYSTIGVFASLSMLSTVFGYKALSGFVDRYGSKPMLQLFILPITVVSFAWVFNTPANYSLVPILMVLNGLFQAGMSAAFSPLLYGLIPDGADKPVFFASRSIMNSIASVTAPLVGRTIVSTFEGAAWTVGGIEVGSLHLLFVISTLVMALPIVFLSLIREMGSSSPRYVLDQLFRGNLVGFAYHQFLFSRTSEEGRKAEAVRGMSRSRSPMAVETLIDALDDASTQVRSDAARGLGEMRRDEAIDPLIQELHDHESDIRTEAAEALGMIGHPRGVDALFEALHDGDARVRVSAIRGLTAIGGEEVQERLFWMFCDEADRVTFPALVDALSRLNDTRIVKPTLERLLSYRSPVIRLQLMNGVCRTLGGEDQFYKLISMDEFTQVDEISALLRRAQKVILTVDALSLSIRQESARGIEDALARFEHGDVNGMGASVSRTGSILRDALKTGLLDQAVIPETASRAIACIITLRTFLAVASPASPVQGSDAFLAVCFVQLARAMTEVR